MFPALLLLAIGADFAPVSDVPVRCLENLRGKVGRARVEIVVGAGAIHEDPDARGVAHLLEHLLLRPLGFDDSNGATAWDYTSYYRDVRGAALSTSAVDLVTALGDVAITPAAFDAERNVVLRELEERGASFRFEHDPMFGSTILERSPGGTIDAVRRLELEDAKRFHAEHYTKGNIAVTLSGAVDCAAILRRLEPLLAKIPDGDASELPRVEASEPGPFPLGSSEDVLIQGFYWYDATPSQEVVWRLVAKHLEQRALDVLRKERGLAYSPSAQIVRRGGGGMLELRVKTDGRADEAAAWFDEEVSALRSSSKPMSHMAAAVDPVRNALLDDSLRIALATIREEPAPESLLSKLDDVAVAKTLEALLVDRRSFGTASPQSNLWSILILALFGAVVVAVLVYLGKELIRG